MSLRNSALSMRPLAFASLVTTAIYVVFQRMAVPTPYRSSQPQRLSHPSPCTGTCCPSRIRRGSESLVALLRLRPHSSLTLLVDLDVNDVRPTADGTVFDILLSRARRRIDGYHDFFTAAITQIARIAPHDDDSTRTMADARHRISKSMFRWRERYGQGVGQEFCAILAIRGLFPYD